MITTWMFALEAKLLQEQQIAIQTYVLEFIFWPINSKMVMDQKITMLKGKFKNMKIFLLNIDLIAFSLHVYYDSSLLKLDADNWCI